jgi:metallophosphoesterase superfamily enzyme
MEFEPRDRALYLPAADTLVCADLHVGKDAASNVQGRLGEYEDLTDRFAALVGRYEPGETVIAGDLLHTFDSVPTGVVETLRRLEETAAAVDCRLVVTPGNHDPMLGELWDGPTEPEYRLGGVETDIIVTHGHVSPEAEADWYVVGHDHPTIEIEGMRRPCYLYGPGQYEGAGVVMLASFSRLPAGVRINRMSTRDFQSPIIGDASALRPIVRDDGAGRTRQFPTLGEFRRFL